MQAAASHGDGSCHPGCVFLVMAVSMVTVQPCLPAPISSCCCCSLGENRGQPASFLCLFNAFPYAEYEMQCNILWLFSFKVCETHPTSSDVCCATTFILSLQMNTDHHVLPLPVTQSLHLAVPAAQKSPAGVRVVGQNSATTANSCGTPTRHATRPGNNGLNT